MKQLLLFLLIFNITIVEAKNYYISAKGLDTNTGLTQATAWQTIAKLNASFGAIAPGDSVLFKCGETFHGSIIVGKSGTSSLPIIFSSYGTGDKPVISGFTTLSSWTNMGGGIWKTNVSGASNLLKIVTINGTLQRMGRYPNYNRTDGGWLTYESSDGSIPSLTDAELITSPINWTGADAVIKKYSYVIDVCPITGQGGGTLSYTFANDFLGNPSTSPGTAGYGYFIQNDLRTLDAFGEWFLNKTTKDLYVFFGSNGPSGYTTLASTQDILLNCGDQGFGTSGTPAYSNITATNLDFEGANKYACYAFNGSNITFQNCKINSCYIGVFIWNINNSKTDGNTITNILNNGIQQYGVNASPTLIANNTISKVGLMEGMGGNGEVSPYSAILQEGDNTTITGNILDSIGFNGIKFQGSNTLVKNNFINHYCAILDDGGGIYSFADKTKTNRVVESNIVINGIGGKFGRVGNNGMTYGIYTDGGSTNISIINNSVSIADGGGYLINSGINLSVTGNTFYNVPIGICTNRFAGDPVDRSLRFARNIIYSSINNFTYSNRSLNTPSTVDIQTDLSAIGSWDSNYYRNDIPKPFDYNYSLTSGGNNIDPSDLNFEAWKSFINGDYNSKTFNKISNYSITNTLSSNTISNGQFNTDIKGFNIYNPINNFEMSWDNSSKITGTGSLKLTNNSSANSEIMVNTSVGSVIAGHTYIVRFKTLGTALSSNINISFRQTNNPYGSFTNPVQYDYTSNSIKQHEFLVTMKETDAATLQIYFDQSTATTFIDNLEFYEVTATSVDMSKQVIFEFNSTNSNKTIILDANYIGVDNTQYNGSITLAPFSSAILFKSGALSAALKADAGTDISLVLPTNSTILKGSANGTLASYTWSLVSGPGQFTIVTPNNPSTTISNLAIGTYTFQLKVVNSVGDSALALVNVTETGVLPVTLIDFTAQNDNNKIIALKWQTASEINVSHYTIERSSNGQDFENIGELKSNNLANIQINYSFNDNFPLKEVNYYRLVMIDIDGTIKYSKTVSVTVSDASSFKLINMALSATENNIKVSLNSNYRQSIQLVVADVSGRIIFTNEVQVQKGFNTIEKKIPAINTGVYYAKLFTNVQIITRTLLSIH
jgi:hypothetical protein